MKARCGEIYLHFLAHACTARLDRGNRNARHSAIGLMSGIILLNACSALLITDLLAQRVLIPLYPHGTIYALVTFIVVDSAHYLWLANRDLNSLVEASLSGTRIPYRSAFWVYVVASFAIFSALVIGTSLAVSGD